VAQVGAAQISTAEVGAVRGGVAERCARHFGAAEDGALQVRRVEYGVVEQRHLHIRTGKHRSGEFGIAQPRAGQVRTLEVGAAGLRFAKVGALPAHALQVHTDGVPRRAGRLGLADVDLCAQTVQSGVEQVQVMTSVRPLRLLHGHGRGRRVHAEGAEREPEHGLFCQLVLLSDAGGRPPDCCIQNLFGDVPFWDQRGNDTGSIDRA
jgi:hypothetical protein